MQSRIATIVLFMISALTYTPAPAELQAELSQDELAFLRECIAEQGNDILMGVHTYGTQRELRILERLALSKWVLANPALTLECKYDDAQSVVRLTASLGDITGAEKALADFLDTYRKTDMSTGGDFGVRKVQFYLPQRELALRREIEECKRYFGQSENYGKAIQCIQMQRDFELAHFSEVPDRLRDELQLVVYFGYYQACGELYEADGDTTHALEQYREALRNYEERNLAAGNDKTVNDYMTKLCVLLRDKISLLSGGGEVRPEDAYRMYKEIIEYHAFRGWSDTEIAKQYLQRFKGAFVGKTFSVDGIAGPRSVKDYVPLETLRFEAIIEESRRNTDLSADYSAAIDKWTQYRDRVASFIPSIQDATVRNAATTYAEFAFRAHCGRLFTTDKNYQKALEFMKEAMKRFDEMKASGVEQSEETKREYDYLTVVVSNSSPGPAGKTEKNAGGRRSDQPTTATAAACGGCGLTEASPKPAESSASGGGCSTASSACMNRDIYHCNTCWTGGRNCCFCTPAPPP